MCYRTELRSVVAKDIKPVGPEPAPLRLALWISLRPEWRLDSPAAAEQIPIDPTSIQARVETGGPRTSNNGLEESQVLPWRRGCGEKPLCIVTKATSSRLAVGEGRGPEKKGEEKGRRRWKEVRQGGSEEEKGEMTSRRRHCWKCSGNVSLGFIIHSISALFTVAGSRLRGRIYSFSLTSSQTKLVSRFF